MPNWSESMQQTFEYYKVDPNTWKDAELITTVKSATINRESDVDTLGSATIDIVDSVGECYIRIYLVTIQNGVKEKHPLGTFLVQTPTSSFDGKTRNVSMDAYTPLLELKEKQPPIGYYVPESVFFKVEYLENLNLYDRTSEAIEPVIGEPIVGAETIYGEQVYKQTATSGEEVLYCIYGFPMDHAYRLTRENLRAPVIKPNSDVPLCSDFVADTSDTWFSFLHDLIANANYTFALDELGRVLFAPKQDTASLQPVWTYDDSNSSILYPDLDMDHDLYGIPNVVEVIFFDGKHNLYAEARNEDDNSPTSIQNRGRKIVYRVTEPEIVGVPSQKQLNEYAKQVLRNLSTVEYTITYSHGYCPVRLGDCVRLNYARAGLTNIKAKVIYQSIKCEAGCKVTEKAVFTNKLWG